MRDLLNTPERAVQDGRVAYGTYRSPFQNLNLLDADSVKPGSFRPQWFRRLRLKEWEHFGVFLGPWYLGVAMVDAKFLGVSWCCLIDTTSGTVREREKKCLPGAIRVPAELWNGSVDLKAGRDYRVFLENRLKKGFHRLVVKVKAQGDFPGVRADLTLWERPEQVQPLIALLPFPDGRPFFSHKSPCLVEGEMTVGKETFSARETESIALLDFHRAFYPHQTFWEWATFAGFDSQGELIGMNLTRNVIERDEFFNENGVWFRNTLRPVGPAEFRIPRNASEAWSMRSRDGDVDLTFQPIGGRAEKIGLGPFVSQYSQPLGLFSGTVTDAEGDVHTIKDMIGLAEDHRVTW